MTQRTTRNSRWAAGFEDLFTSLNPSGNQSQVPTLHHIHQLPYTCHPHNPNPHTSKLWMKLWWKTSGNPNNEAEAFAKAIDKIIKANYGSSKSKPKLWEPDPFNGSDSQKLRTFILQCKLNFRDCPDQFQNDATKVNYILSYLKGSALDCFKPALLDPIEPFWLRPQSFHRGTWNPFRNYNPVGEAEAELEGLACRNTTSYKVFHQIPAVIHTRSVGEAALRRQAYNDSPIESKTTWSTTTSRTPFPAP